MSQNSAPENKETYSKTVILKRMKRLIVRQHANVNSQASCEPGTGKLREFCRGIHTLWTEGVKVVIGGGRDDQPRPNCV